MRILRAAIASLDGLVFALRKASEAADADVSSEREHRRKNGRSRYHLEDLQAKARLASGVWAEVSAATLRMHDEINSLRAARIKQLYE